MTQWQCFHLDDTVTAMVIPDNSGRFLVRLREPAGGSKNAIEFYRGNLKEAQRAADRLVQAYYPHDCKEARCGQWESLDG